MRLVRTIHKQFIAPIRRNTRYSLAVHEMGLTTKYEACKYKNSKKSQKTAIFKQIFCLQFLSMSRQQQKNMKKNDQLSAYFSHFLQNAQNTIISK